MLSEKDGVVRRQIWKLGMIGQLIMELSQD